MVTLLRTEERGRRGRKVGETEERQHTSHKLVPPAKNDGIVHCADAACVSARRRAPTGRQANVRITGRMQIKSSQQNANRQKHNVKQSYSLEKGDHTVIGTRSSCCLPNMTRERALDSEFLDLGICSSSQQQQEKTCRQMSKEEITSFMFITDDEKAPFS
ncbi:hypothetical protein Ancab_011932 [Ancistrocladus abbreviatus]